MLELDSGDSLGGLGHRKVKIMLVNCHRRTLFVCIAIAGLAGCGSSGTTPLATDSFDSELHSIADTVSIATAYPKGAVDVVGTRVRLRISISDAKLSSADQSTREQVATTVVAAAEQALGKFPKVNTVEAISVAILHSNAPGEVPSAWHIEDVVEFRKGPGERFSMHGPT